MAFLLDDLLLAPVRGVAWIARQLQRAAQDQLESDADSTRQELRELYMALETGRITEDEFDAREAELLGRLERLEDGAAMAEGADRDGAP